MQGGSDSTQYRSSSTFHRRQPSAVLSSSPPPYLYPVSGPSRSSSAAVSSPTSGPRFRTILHPEHHVDRELRKQLRQSRDRLASAFDAIAAKYGSTRPEDDDELDLYSLKICTDRGAVQSLEARPFAEGSDYADEAIEDDDDFDHLRRLQSEPVRGPENAAFGADEDELGDWGDRSGLDPQYPRTEIENEWTTEDIRDLDDFMRAEAERRQRYGEEPMPEPGRPSYPSSSPLRRLGDLVLGSSPRVEASVMDSTPQLRKDSRVSRGPHKTVSRRVGAQAHHQPSRHSSSTPRAVQHDPQPHHLVDDTIAETSPSNPHLMVAPTSPSPRGRPSRSRSSSFTGSAQSEDQESSASEEGSQYEPSETESDDSMLSDEHADDQLLVDIQQGVTANYSLPATGGNHRVAFNHNNDSATLSPAKCPRCIAAGGKRAEQAMWCSGREARGACLHDAKPASSTSAPATSSGAKRRGKLVTPPQSDRATVHGDLSDTPDNDTTCGDDSDQQDARTERPHSRSSMRSVQSGSYFPTPSPSKSPPGSVTGSSKSLPALMPGSSKAGTGAEAGSSKSMPTTTHGKWSSPPSPPPSTVGSSKSPPGLVADPFQYLPIAEHGRWKPPPSPSSSVYGWSKSPPPSTSSSSKSPSSDAPLPSRCQTVTPRPVPAWLSSQANLGVGPHGPGPNPSSSPTPSSTVASSRGAVKPLPTLAASVSQGSYTLRAPAKSNNSAGLMLPPPVPRTPISASSRSSSAAPPVPQTAPRPTTSTSSRASMPPAPQTTPRKRIPPPPQTTTPRRSQPAPQAPQTTPRKRIRDPDSDSDSEAPAEPKRERSQSVSVSSWKPPTSTPRRKTRMERRVQQEASKLADDDDLEWGLDLDVGLDVARSFREGSIALPVNPPTPGLRRSERR